MQEYLSVFLSEFTLLQIGMGIAIVFVATGIQYALGIGFGTIVGPILAIINIGFVPVASLILTFMTASLSLKSEWRKISWVEIRTSISARFVGAVIAGFVLASLPSEKTFLLLFGLIVGFFVLLSVSGLKIPFNLKTLGIAGTVSGFTATITGVGGPPMALVYQDQDASKARPTLQAFFVFASFVSLIVLLFTGYVKTVHIVGTIALLPGLLGGPILGPLLRPYANEYFKYVILLITAIASAVLIYRGLS